MIQVKEEQFQTYYPYKTTIDTINKIEYEFSPRDKFETLMKAILELKTSILDLTGGKTELDSLDDELPLTIYVVSQIKLKNAFAELNIIDDYFRFSRDCIDKESKILTNMKGAVQFISTMWEFE